MHICYFLAGTCFEVKVTKESVGKLKQTFATLDKSMNRPTATHVFKEDMDRIRELLTTAEKDLGNAA